MVVLENQITLLPYIVQDVEPQSEIQANITQVAAPSFWTKTKGGGAVVAVIDTGLDVNHPEFAGRIYKATNMTNADKNIVDQQGHGTHVAGIIAGASCGVAPEARIWPFKVVTDGKEYLTTAFINEAFRTILAHNRTCVPEDKVVAVNCSFSGISYDPYMAYMIRSLVEQGVTVVAAAGNQGDGKADTYEIASYPAYLWECLTVGALNKDLSSAAYSSSFDGIDLAAPGTEVYSAWPGGGYKLLSGTSMAAPHVTGAMALIYDAWRKREGVWPTEEEAVKILMKHIRKVEIDSRLVGAGMLNLAWSNLRWPLHRVQLGAFYNEAGCNAKAAELKGMGLDTYKVKY